MRLQFERLAGIDFPSNISFSEKNRDIFVMQMTPDGLGLGDNVANMQDDKAAFEAWALIIKAHGYDKIILEGDVPDFSGFSHPHYNRFLYRARRFCENFDWFILSDKLELAASTFHKKVFEDGLNLKLNAPSNLGTSEPNNPESKTEHNFIKTPDKLRELSKINADEFFRQLPVGLFFDRVSDETGIFPGGKAAIDLWAVEDDCIHIIELKKGANKSLGILSELFFYVNFIYDFYCLKLASAECASKNRGYVKLSTSSAKSVCGHVLTENKHPQLDSAIAQLALCKNKNIRFEQAVTYDAQIWL